MGTTCVVSRRVADIEASDTLQWYNDTGADVVTNQLIPKTVGSNQAMVLVAAMAIPSATTGTVIRKMIVELPASTSASISQGQVVQYVPSATSVSVAGTASGTVCVGMATDDAATSVGYVKVALNEGPKAFYAW
jgi:predicted RecA/RadA family phage recombinase